MLTFVYILLSLLAAAIFSATGVAFVASEKLQFEVSRNKKRITNETVLFFYRFPNLFLITLMVGYIFSLVAYCYLMIQAFQPWIEIARYQVLGLSLLAVFATIILLICGDILPRIVIKNNPDFTLELLSIPLFILFILFYPVTIIISFLATAFQWATGNATAKPSKATFDKEDLDSFIQKNFDETEEAGMEPEVKIFQNALDFSSVRLRDCMVPRTEIVSCDLATPIDELRNRFIETGLSKIIIFDENIDHIVGYIHSSELFHNPQDWTHCVQKLPIVPETMAANKLMKAFMQDKKSIAVVVDEFGGTAGIVTLEDIVEEIFGDIEDEHDVKSLIAKEVGKNEYVLSGRMEIDDVNEKFDLDIPESDNYVTIAGFILFYYEKLPKQNETIQIDRFQFKIIKVTETKIELVRLKVGTT